MEIVSSLRNSFICQADVLKDKKNREDTGLFVIEGERFVSEIPDDWHVSFFLLSTHYAETHSIESFKNKARTIIVSEKAFQKASDAVTPQGVLAVCRQKKFTLSDFFISDKPLLLLLLEEIRDPGNVGTMLRIADAASVDGVILSAQCADVYNPKVLRAAAGSVFHIPFLQNANLLELAPVLKQRDIMIVASHLKTDFFPHSLDFTQNCAIIIGNEANGLSDSIYALSDQKVKIPMPGRAESLNASVACGILMYEAVRQRLCNDKNII